MNFMDKTCAGFVGELASNAPVPGGGGASALVSALGTALGNMVGGLTVGKKKYADVEADVQALMEQASALQQRLLKLAERDAEVFAPLAAAYRMPKETEAEKAEKERVMAAVLKDAAQVPLEIMEGCCQAIDLLAEFAAKGNRTAISDAGGGVIFCKAALQSASLNVFINTGSMKDRQLAQRLEAEADRMLQEYTVKADEVYACVFHELRK